MSLKNELKDLVLEALAFVITAKRALTPFWLNCSIKSSILHKHASFTQRFVKGRCQFL